VSRAGNRPPATIRVLRKLSDGSIREPEVGNQQRCGEHAKQTKCFPR